MDFSPVITQENILNPTKKIFMLTIHLSFCLNTLQLQAMYFSYCGSHNNAVTSIHEEYKETIYQKVSYFSLIGLLILKIILIFKKQSDN